MNQNKRDRIADIAGVLQEQFEHLTELKEEEEEIQGNRPENLAESEAAQLSETVINNLDSAINDLEALISTLEDVES